MARTDEPIIAEKQKKLDAMSDEEKAIYCNNEYKEDLKICAKLSQELKANIQPIVGDIHHIKVNGQVYGYNAFSQWKRNRIRQLESGTAPSGKLGFFNSQK